MTPIEQLIEWLRDEHRMKLNCDYAYIHKYGGFQFLCDSAWIEYIMLGCKLYSIPLTAILATDNRSWGPPTKEEVDAGK